MNTKLRPGILSKWLISRKFHALPNVDDVGGYAKEWLSWWNSVQPKWRQLSVTGSLPLALRLDTGAPVGLPGPYPWVFRAPKLIPRPAKIFSHGSPGSAGQKPVGH